MGQRNGSSVSEMQDRFAHDVAIWVVKNGFLIDALVGLRRLGKEAEEAVVAVMKIRRVEQFRLGWELWVALEEGAGRSPSDELARRLSARVLRTTVEAFWGSPWDTHLQRRLRSV